MTFSGKYRLSSTDVLGQLVMRISFSRRSTAFKFGRSNSVLDEANETNLEFQWKQAVEQSQNEIFTLANQQIIDNLFPVVEGKHESIISKKEKMVSSSNTENPGAKFIVETNYKRDLRAPSEKMLIMTELHSQSSSENDSTLKRALIICELCLTADSSGYLLTVTPDFSSEPYVLRGESEEAYLLRVEVKGVNLLHEVRLLSSNKAVDERSKTLSKKTLAMPISQPKEGHTKVTIFGEIVAATGFEKNQSIFVLYSGSSPQGWTLLGRKKEDALNSTFSCVSRPQLSSRLGHRKNIALFGHPFHLNYTTTVPENMPRLHVKIVHFCPEKERFYTLGTGSLAMQNSGVYRVPVVREMPKGIIPRLREKYLGGNSHLTGIVINQKVAADSYTVPTGELYVRLEIVRQSRKFRLEDLLIASRTRLLESSGQTLSTVQVALSAFQEARLKMIQARQDQKSLVEETHYRT